MTKINNYKPSEKLRRFLPKNILVDAYLRMVGEKIDRIIASDSVSTREKIIKGITGNRISFAGYSSAMALIGTGDAIGIFYGIFLLVCTFPGLSGFSIGTLSAYIRTLEHIERNGNIDERFFQTFIRRDKDEKYTGYCELQGMYLAAKALDAEYPGLLEQFSKLKQKFTKNKIPNF